MTDKPDKNQTPLPGNPPASAGGPDKATPPPDTTSTKDAADPFDPATLRLTQNFLKTGGVKKHIPSLSSRKATKEEWFQVRSEPEFTLDTLVLELKDSGETYLIAPGLHADLVTEKTVTARRILVAVNRQGSPFLWPLKLPSPDGRQDRWAESALEAAEAATKTWVRMQADMGLGAYVFFTPVGELPPPEWPDMDLRQMLKLAFRNNFIDSFDHIVLRRLRGEV
jgi:hypothetical protein